MKLKHWTTILIGLLILSSGALWSVQKLNFKSDFKVGQEIDSLNGVVVYYNGDVSNVIERNTTKDGYNIGLKYQCVEFVKRYYFEHLNHKMPDSYGNAKDFFDSSLSDGQLNKQRNLAQYSNPSKTNPKVDDLLILKETIFNKYGHVAIVSKVTENEIEIIQQNPGPFENSRETYTIEKQNGKWLIENDRILGWLRKEN